MSAIYSDEHRETIKTAWLAGESAGVIAKALLATFGMIVPDSSIYSIARKLKLPPRATKKSVAVAKKSIPLELSGGPDGVPPLCAPGEYPETGCRWIHGDNTAQFQFCGHRQLAHSPYCGHHAARARGAQPKPMSGPSRADRVMR